MAITLSACETPDGQVAQTPGVFEGATVARLDSDLLEVTARMSGLAVPNDLNTYADCVASQYALARGFGFTRHIRTNFSEEAGIRRADAVYSISPAIPRGARTLDTEVVVANCKENGIPTL